MLLNRVETLMMNNPLRAVVQRHFECRRLLGLGGPLDGGRALEVGCGRGVGAELILDRFGVERLDAFDLDPQMVALAARRLERFGDRVRVRQGDVTAIDAADGRYAAVFDFGIIHHVPDWRAALCEIHRVLQPGGRFYAEEVLERFILNPVWRRLLRHPETDRFDAPAFAAALGEVGFEQLAERQLWGWFTWVVARKPRLAA